jgi:hydroxymethylpyrimidine pyrophosphatase-like HAD family hydrolase
MRYQALACDYDGTIARHGNVTDSTLEALRRLRASGRKLLLLTGREVPDLLRVFHQSDLFDVIVAENGAVLYSPLTKESRPLCNPPPPEFVEALRQREVRPISMGQVIVATQEPWETVVLDVIRRLGLELQVIFNKGAVMILPAGTNKASGLAAGLRQLCLSAHSVVGVGDAENDHAFLDACECAVAVSNALEAVRQRVDHVTARDHGGGVEELIDLLVETDLVSLEDRLTRHELLIGHDANGDEVRLKPYGQNVMLGGSSGGGKSTFVRSLFERLMENRYQTLVVDPEGDYEGIPDASSLGSAQRAPTVEEAVNSLEQPDHHTVVNLLGLKLEERPVFFQQLFLRVSELRARTGRPHWIICDETHHLLPKDHQGSLGLLPMDRKSIVFVTVDPASVIPEVLTTIDVLLVSGASAQEALERFCAQRQCTPPAVPKAPIAPGEMLAWWTATSRVVHLARIVAPKSLHRRHVRKYMQGELAPEESFYFRGRDGKLKLRAQNLEMFLRLSEGIDDDTWEFHRARNDYSQWFRNNLNDPDLAAAVEKIENSTSRNVEKSKDAVRREIERRYTAPA